MRIEFDVVGVAVDPDAHERLVRRLEAELGRMSGRLDRVAVRLVDAGERDRPGCPGRDRFEGSVRVRGRSGEEFSLRGEGDDPESLVERLVERAGRTVRRRADPASGARRPRRSEAWR